MQKYDSCEWIRAKWSLRVRERVRTSVTHGEGVRHLHTPGIGLSRLFRSHVWNVGNLMPIIVRPRAVMPCYDECFNLLKRMLNALKYA